MERQAHGCADPVLDLYGKLLDYSWLNDRRFALETAYGGGLFSPALTMWIMARQRLLGGCSVETGWATCSVDEAQLLSPTSARARSGVLSSSPSGLDYARHALPLVLAMDACSHLEEEAHAVLGNTGLRTYLLDGSTLTPNWSEELDKAFPPASNGHGLSHWPVVLMVVAHDYQTGLATLPEWGPMYGPDATNESRLALPVIARLPKDSLIIADRNFGIFRIAWELRDRAMLIRLTTQRAQALLGKSADLNVDSDQPYVWKPSKLESKKYPDLPADACVQGRIVVRHVVDSSGEPVEVCLFTTDMSSSAEEVLLAYPTRWFIESDLRSLKTTLRLEIVRAKSPDMLGKELVMAVMAYNLIRTFMALAARKAKLSPRRISFSRTVSYITAYAMRGTLTPKEFGQMLVAIAARPIPLRKKRKNPPRTVWRRPTGYPARKPPQR